MPEVFDSWAIVELMGHVKMAGRLTEEERFGSKLGRLDVPVKRCCPECGGLGNGPDRMNGNEVVQDDCPACDGKGETESYSTVYFNGASVYRLSPCSEEVARHVAKRNQPEPVHQWELPKQIEAPATRRHDEGSFFDPDDEDDDSRDLEL